jgi:hypothetical protein
VKKTNAALRKPPPVSQPVDPAAVDQFVSGGLDTQTSRRSAPMPLQSIVAPAGSTEAPGSLDAQTSERSARTSKAVVERADGRTLRRMTVYLPTDLAKHLALYCAEHDRDMSEVIAASVARTLGRSDV